MITLALELSSPRNSLALFRDSVCVAKESWTADRCGHRVVFDALYRALDQAALPPAEIGRVVAGRGPGNYTGMRLALTVAEVLLIPGGGELIAVSSGAALARAALRASAHGRVAIVGDARRDRLWFGLFERDPEGHVRTRADWSLCRAAELKSRLPADTQLASPDYEKLKTALPDCEELWIPDGPHFPDAAELALLAFERARAGCPPEPATPIYMHPAVQPVAG